MLTETRNHEAEITPPASSQAGGTAAPLPLFAGAPPASSQAGVAPLKLSLFSAALRASKTGGTAALSPLAPAEVTETRDFDLDTDVDPFDCVEQQHLDLPQEIVSKISEQTKTPLLCSATLPAHHFKSNSLRTIDQNSVKVILKYPGRNKYLLFDSKKPGTFFFFQEDEMINSKKQAQLHHFWQEHATAFLPCSKKSMVCAET